MSTLYISKYPVNIGQDKENKNIFAPAQTTFRISEVFCSCLVLKAVVKIPDTYNAQPIMVTPEILAFAFTETEFIKGEE